METLIEHGALVSELDSATPPAPALGNLDWRLCWPLTFRDPADIRRRRPRLAGNQVRVPGTLAHQLHLLKKQAAAAGQSLPADLLEKPEPFTVPAAPRQLSTHPATLRSRERYRRRVREERKHAWLQARQELLDYKQRVREGRARPSSPAVMELMEREVRAMYAGIDAWD